MFCHISKETHGFRWWLHIGQRRSCIKVECYWWSPRCGASIESSDDGWDISIRFPPLALYLSLDGLGLWQPKQTVVATWDNNREFTVPDRRECGISISDWTIRFELWGRWGEWCAADPWWIRGVSVNLKDLALGRSDCTTETLATVPTAVTMPEGVYQAVATIERRTWKRRRWVSHTRTSAWLDIPKGIPHAGKGENSWDCGDDGLFGIGGDSIEHAVQRAQESVAKSRRDYGHASDETMLKALT